LGTRVSDFTEGNVLEALLRLPITVTMDGRQASEVARLQAVARAQDLLLESTGKLLRIDHPPPELLRLVKDYAKSNLVAGGADVARRAAFRAIYLLAIAAAVVRTNEAVSTLDDATLVEQMKWLADQQDLSPDLRDLANKARQRIASGAMTRLTGQ
jgi:hypothetical protein